VAGMLEPAREVLLELETRLHDQAHAATAAELAEWNRQATFARGMIERMARRRSAIRGDKIRELTPTEEADRMTEAKKAEDSTDHQADLF
jgi:hypothetical protein